MEATAARFGNGGEFFCGELSGRAWRDDDWFGNVGERGGFATEDGEGAGVRRRNGDGGIDPHDGEGFLFGWRGWNEDGYFEGRGNVGAGGRSKRVRLGYRSTFFRRCEK